MRTLTSLAPRERLERVLVDGEVSRFYPISYGRGIWDTVLALRPAVMVEFGVHRGYSAIIAALAMEEAGSGHLKAYDWWEDGRREGFDEERIALDHFARYDVGHRITLQAMDFHDWIGRPELCDLLYFDIDNDGDKIEAMFSGLQSQIERGLTVLFEGGCAERDRHESMIGRTPIRAVQQLTGYRIVVDDFPSLSVISRAHGANREGPRGRGLA
jgi:hypothetical protein